MSRSRKGVIAVLLILLLLTAGYFGFDPIREWVGAGSSGSSGEVVANLSGIHNTVNHRDRASLRWENAALDMPLGDGDKIRTQDGSQAKVRFLAGSELIVDEKTLITIRAPKRIGNRLVADVEITDGRLRASLSRGSDGADQVLTIRGANGEVTEISTEGSEGFAELSVMMRPDRSSRIAVHRGQAKLVGMGQTITLDEGQTAGTGADGGPLERQGSQAPAPKPASPSAGEQVSLTAAEGEPLPVVDLTWSPVARAGGYKVEIAKDEEFDEVEELGELPADTTRFGFAPGEPGEYYWRVLTLDSSLAPGAASETRSFRIVRADPKPKPTPKAVVKRTPKPTPKPTLPPPRDVLEGVAGQPLVVQGKAKKGAMHVTVNGIPARLERDGAYKIELKNLQAGKRVVVIESIFEDGTVLHENREAIIR